MFESARVKLTFFYLAVLLSFSLLLTFGLRTVIRAELSRANNLQRGVVHDIGQEYFTQWDTPPPENPDRTFARIQHLQDNETKERLNRGMALLNVGVLLLGGMLSYWYAGRTLKPIQQAHEKQKRFTADASHELRTPLASMRLENEVFLRQKTFVEAEARDQLASNLEEVERLERLTTSLLDLNRYENTKLSRQKLPVRSVVDEAVKRAGYAQRAKKISFKKHVTKATVLGDRESVVQMLGILLDNAVKYGPADGLVEVTGKLEDKNYVLTVRDHGAGVAAEDMLHVFERMYRGDKARSNVVSGHGIGLSLAREIAAANGLEITVDNHAEGGAVFSIHFTGV